MQQTTLPPELPENVIVMPTLDRWGRNGAGPLPRAISSIQKAVVRDDIADDTWMIVSDATTDEHVHADATGVREQGLNDKSLPDKGARLFVMTPETQAIVARVVAKRTGVREAVARAIMTDTGYASQRKKLDALLAGAVLNSGGSSRVLTLDDDTLIPSERRVVRPGHLPAGFSQLPNSQILLPDGDVHDGIFETSSNSLKPLFNALGRRVGDGRRNGLAGMRVTDMAKDTMNEALGDSIYGKASQFVVTHSDAPDIEGADNARIIAATVSKHGIPDYRTALIARASYEGNLPRAEVAMSSYVSGDEQPFGFVTSATNVDSATLARSFDEKSAVMPWWFVSSDAISRQNPLGTVNGHYRADNELLPQLLRLASRSGDEQMVYASGLGTQISHHRARSGYRPNLHEQAASSLVGNVAATEAMKLLHIDPSTGFGALEEVGDDYMVPREKAEQVFQSLKDLADICSAKMREFSSTHIPMTGALNVHALEEGNFNNYRAIFNSLKSRLGGFDFDTFYRHLNVEIREQLSFYKEVLDAYTSVVDEVRGLIAAGQYPIEEYVDARAQSAVYMSAPVVYAAHASAGGAA